VQQGLMLSTEADPQIAVLDVQSEAAASPLNLPRQNAKLPTVQALRGVAAMAVCWFHLTYGMPGFLDAGWLKQSGMYGWLGVQVFFVISGFLIPYTLFHGGYNLRQFGSFLKKRLVRLHPPYLITLVVVLGYRYVEVVLPVPRSKQIPVQWGQLVAHLGFLNPIFGYKWFVGVFWTLAVEFQFYLLLGLTYGLLAGRRRWLGCAWCALLALSAFVWPSQEYLPHHLPVFCFGLFAFRYACLGTGWVELLAGMAFAAALCHRTNGPPATYVAIGTALLILFVRYSNRILNFFGEISYSLYLLHAPIGGAIVYEGLKRFSGGGKPFLLAFAYVGSLLSACVLYRLIELPSKRWAARIGQSR
jgi:peptidoglycan/LPS O-acetylase OafA/YrhL